MHRALITFLTCLLTPFAMAGWELDNGDSSLSFVTVKNGTVVEAHVFHSLEGEVTDEGMATVTVKLDSVDTAIPIRNERMQQMLFETGMYPDATFKAQVPITELAHLSSSDSMDYELAGTLTVHGVSVEASVPVSITEAGEGTYLVTSQKPLLVHADSFNLVAGIEALREIAGLTAITATVPVTFSLVFRAS